MGVAERRLAALVVAAIGLASACSGGSEVRPPRAAGPRNLEPARILVEPNGDALVGGVALARGEGTRCWGNEPQVRDLVFVRLGRDGRRRGLVELSGHDLGACVGSLTAAHPLPDGGLLVSGWTALEPSELGAQRLPFAARLTASGGLDRSFGEEGVLGTGHPTAAAAPVAAGLYVASGALYADDGSQAQSVVVPGEIEDVIPLDRLRVAVAYLRRGAYRVAVFEPRPAPGRLPDRGGVELHPPTERSSPDTIRILSRGDRLYVLVVVGLWQGPGYLSVVARHFRSGGLDPAFGDRGWASVEPRRFPAAVDDIAVGPDGSLVAAGQMDEDGRRVVFLARWAADGGRDRDFGEDGLVRLDLGRATPNIYADARTAVGVRSDGAVLVAASVVGRSPLLASLGADGRPETSFGQGGVLRLAGV